MVDLKTLRQLVKLMKDNDLSELDIQDQESHVTLKRPGAEGPAGAGGVQYVPTAQPVAPGAPPPMSSPPGSPPAPPQSGGAGSEGGGPQGAAEEGMLEVTSPMVGTFYAAPTPDSEPFVRVGTKIEPQSVVCIVEAMKVFNEIKAEVGGTIEKVLVSTGDAVEFGQPLYLVKP